MTAFESQLIEALMQCGVQGRVGQLRQISQEHGDELLAQVVDVKADSRIDVTRLAALLEPNRPKHFVLSLESGRFAGQGCELVR
jgi:hypothetical protein